LTIRKIFDGAEVQMPPGYAPFKKAERVTKNEGVQGELGI